MPNFIIARALGNELPPRDFPGGRISALQRILTLYERPAITSGDRLWLLNRIADPALRDAYIALLERHGESYIETPLDLDEYAIAETVDEKLCAAIGINDARNTLINAGLERADAVLLLDGDCFLTAADYIELSNALVDHTLDYFSLRMLRVAADDPARVLAEGEPTVGFRAGATLRFDPAIPFGRSDKLELLYRIGHSRLNPHVALERTDMTRVLGTCRHTATGPEDVDVDTMVRQARRAESLRTLLDTLDARVAS